MTSPLAHEDRSVEANRERGKLLRDQLEHEGFAILRGLLPPSEVADLRQQVRTIFATGAKYEGDHENHPVYGSVKMDALSRYPELRSIVSRSGFVDTLKAVLGDDFLLVPDSVLHRGAFGGWHKDTDTQEQGGHMYQWQSDFRMITCALYLQDNDPQYGGGLDVWPRSHKYPNRLMLHYETPMVQVLQHKVARRLLRSGVLPAGTLGDISVPSRAGDLVLFDFRTEHKATWPKTRPIPADKEKYAFFVSIGAGNAHTKAFVEFLKTRPDYVYLRGYRYPAPILEMAERSGLHLPDM